MTANQSRFFLCLARRIVPESETLDEAGRQRFLTIIGDALATRTPKMRKQVAIFLKMMRWLPAMRYGLPLDKLAPERQDAVLRWFQDHPRALLRKGFWGIKALVYMGYYGRPEVHERLGYRPSTSGNELLHAR